MAEGQHRESDNHTLNIDHMIINEPDPKQRAFLIVLNSINQSLVANTRITADLSERLETIAANFEAHAEIDAANTNKRLGAWKVIAYVIGGIQFIGLGIWQGARADISAIHTAIQAGQVQHAEFNARISHLEKKP